MNTEFYVVMRIVFLLVSVSFVFNAFSQQIYTTKSGAVKFTSDAPLEVIKAQSSTLNAAINPTTRTFAFTIAMTSFYGFNSSLQREHFNENYMESTKYPMGIFKGKIIEEVDFKQNGTYTVRTKGTLLIHGVEQERIIKSSITVNGNQITLNATFEVLLADHKITIPKIVNQKIAEVIQVKVNAALTPRLS